MDIATIRHRINSATSLEELEELSDDIANGAATGRLDDLAASQIGQLKLEICAKVGPFREAAHKYVAGLIGRIDRNTTDAVAEVRRQQDAVKSQTQCAEK